MKRIVNFRIFGLAVAIAALLAWGLHAISHLNYLVCFGLVVAGIAINGWIATFEDEMPGGFHNPTPNNHSDRRR